MKKIIVIIMLALSFNVIESNKAQASSGGDLGQQLYPPPGLFSGLVKVYNQLINKTKETIQTNMNKLSSSAMKLLATKGVVYLVIVTGRSLLVGEYLLKDSVLKVGLMLILMGLLNFKYYDMYVIQNLEVAFNQIPTILGSNGGGSAIENIIMQTSNIAEQIWVTISGLSWMNAVVGYVMGGFAIFSLVLLILIVVTNVLFATIKFYLVLSLSSIFIMLFFFKFTRNFSMGAVQVVMGAIINLILLSMFLNLFGGVVSGLLSFDAKDFFLTCLSIILISSVGFT